MQIKMDTDAVRSMSSRFRQTADSMDASLASIKATVEAAGWQSQAREEFIMRLEMLRRTSTQSATVLRMMAEAADQKAEQWEAIANVFNGPFHSMGNIWSSVVAFFSGIGNSVWNAITNIQLPSLPSWVLPSISGATVIGWITSIIQNGNGIHLTGGRLERVKISIQAVMLVEVEVVHGMVKMKRLREPPLLAHKRPKFHPNMLQPYPSLTLSRQLAPN